MENPNAYSQVKVLSNPVKSVACRQTFTKTSTAATCKVFRDLLDLNTGVWQVAVGQVIVRNIGDFNVLSIFDLKSNLCSSYEHIHGYPICVDECISSFRVSLYPKTAFLYQPYFPVFFTVQSACASEYKLYLTENLTSMDPTVEQAYKLDVEVRLLFQRMA